MKRTFFVILCCLVYPAAAEADAGPYPIPPVSGASLNAQNITLDANHDSRDGGGTTTRTWEVEQRREQLPRAAPGAAAEGGDGGEPTTRTGGKSANAPSLAHGPRLDPIGESSELKAKNKASSDAIGISFGTSGFGIVIGATSAKGKGEGNTETHIESTVNAGRNGDVDQLPLSPTRERAKGEGETSGTLTLHSGRDTILQGAVVSGNTVIANIGRDLTLQSQQDIDNYKNKQTTSGGSIMIGAGFSASASYSQSNIKSTYKSVNEQTAINAGEGGFDIYVKNHTDLKGAVISSKADKEKNHLSTKTLSYSNIENEAEYSASSYGISLSYSSGGSDGKGLNDSKEAPIGNWSNQGGKGSGITPTLGLPQSGKESSITYAAISPAIIDIRDEAAQKAKTGQTIEETLAGLSRDPSKANNALAKIFDQKKVEETQELTRVLGEEIYQGIGDLAANRRKAALDEEAKATQRPQNAQLAGDAEAQAAAEAEAKIARDTAERWSDGGTYKIALHALGGAVLAKAGNVSVTQAVTAATLNEITIPTIAELAKKEKLSESETKLLHQLTSLAVGGAVGNTTGAAVALTATQNNYLNHKEMMELHDAQRACQGGDQSACARRDELARLDDARNEVLFATCTVNPASADCARLKREADAFNASISTSFGLAGKPEIWTNWLLGRDSKAIEEAMALEYAKTDMVLQLANGKSLQDVLTQYANYDTARQYLLKTAAVAGALALIPGTGAIAGEVALFARNPVSYCLTNPAGCTVAATSVTEAAAYTATGTASPSSAIPNGPGKVAATAANEAKGAKTAGTFMDDVATTNEATVVSRAGAKPVREPADPYDVVAWKEYYDANPGVARAVGAEATKAETTTITAVPGSESLKTRSGNPETSANAARTQPYGPTATANLGATSVETNTELARRDFSYSRAEEVNKTFGRPPYAPTTQVVEFTTGQVERYVRVVSDPIKVEGQWLMRAEDIQGLTAQQIKDKYALPTLPTHVVEVDIPKSLRLRMGEANSIPEWGRGTGWQVQIVNRDDLSKVKFSNLRPLP